MTDVVHYVTLNSLTVFFSRVFILCNEQMKHVKHSLNASRTSITCI